MILGCWYYARAFARTPSQRRLVIAMGAALALLQLGLDMVEAATEAQPWSPSLARVSSASHVQQDPPAEDE